MRQIRFKLAALSAAALLVACGGGSSTPQISGLAATGAALGNASITVKCASGAPVTGTTSADGTFAVVLSGGQAVPCLIQVSKGAVTLYSFASASGRSNVTPVTDLVVTKALGSDPAAAFASFDSTKGASINAGLSAAKDYVKAQILAFCSSFNMPFRMAASPKVVIARSFPSVCCLLRLMKLEQLDISTMHLISIIAHAKTMSQKSKPFSHGENAAGLTRIWKCRRKAMPSQKWCRSMWRKCATGNWCCWTRPKRR